MLVGACFLLAGCSGPLTGHAAGPPSSGMTIHVCRGDAQAELLKWREHDGVLSGTYEYQWLSGHAPSEAFNSISSDLRGTLRGTAITLNLGFSHPLLGQLDGGQFSLSVPQPDGTAKTLICQPGKMADWVSASTALTNQLNEDNNRPASPAGT
jgi:hypothetical protein